MFKYDFGKGGVWPMGINHKLSPSHPWDGEPCLKKCCGSLTQVLGSFSHAELGGGGGHNKFSPFPTGRSFSCKMWIQ